VDGHWKAMLIPPSLPAVPLAPEMTVTPDVQSPAL